jgi:DNA polymerase epsilon subunit 1
VETVKREEVAKRVKVFGNVARGYGLRMLGVVVDEVLGGL